MFSCRHAPADAVRARIDRAPKDSTLFSAPAAAHFCRKGGVLIDAVSGAYGVLAWIRAPGNPGPGDYPLLARGDSATPRGALVAVRFLSHDIAHGFPVDSGVVTLTAAGAGRWLRGVVRGSGTDLGTATRVQVRITIDSLKLQSDTLVCGATG